MEKFEIQKITQNLSERLDAITVIIKPEEVQKRIASFEAEMIQADFWDDATHASKIIQASNELKETLSTYQELLKELDELKTILQLDDEELFQEAESIIDKCEKDLEEFENRLLLQGEYDHLPAIIDIHPGAGGTESQDWALMLYRMYKRFAERRNADFELIDYQEANDAGLKSVTFLIKGKFAYGILKGEKGVHRLVRISPFDSNARRHTSFAAVNVTPEIDDQIQIEIKPEELKIDTYRSSGAGGQHVNTTDSAVRITHLPTGIVVSCQNERSQIQNRERAMNILRSKLYQNIQETQTQKLKAIGGALEENAFGSQIRSYVLHPYAMVKDHRTNVESSNPTNVLDGDIDLFINAYLRSISKI